VFQSVLRRSALSNSESTGNFGQGAFPSLTKLNAAKAARKIGAGLPAANAKTATRSLI